MLFLSFAASEVPRRMLATLMLLGLVSMASLFLTACAIAQEATGKQATGQSGASGTDESIPTEYFPPVAISAVSIVPQQVLSSPDMRLLPIEVADAWTKEQFGVPIQEVQSIVAMFGPPTPMGPTVGVVIKTSRPVDVTKMSPQMIDPQPIAVGPYAAYAIREMPEMLVHQASETCVLVATEPMLIEMKKAPQGTGPLAQFAAKVPQSAPLVAVAVMEPIRALAQQAQGAIPPDVPPSIADLVELPELIEGMIVSGGVTITDPFRVEMIARDEEGAAEAKQILEEAVEFGREMFVASAQTEMQDEGPVADAMRAYMERLAGEIAAMFQPKLDGRRLVMQSEGVGGAGIGSTGVMIGLLLPAVQAAREAARRTSSMNNLKQMMLAMFNYESAYRKFPAQTSRDEDGKPLLSWRVAILPFIEEGELYNQFHHDEPWDSEHNIKLLDKMPVVYQNPSLVLPPGMTVYQVVSGPEYAFPSDRPLRLSEVRDGTSNTIAIVETNAAHAVPWTKPEDSPIDPNNPFLTVIGGRPGGFLVGMMDGSVQFIADSVDPQTFLEMLTRAGGEVPSP